MLPSRHQGIRTNAALIGLPWCGADTSALCTSALLARHLSIPLTLFPLLVLSLPAAAAVSCVQPIVQWGFIPAIIVAGMLFTKPRPTLGQLVLLG